MEEPTIGGARPTLWVAVVGAGPAGYYTAEALAKQRDDIHIDILDRLPTPFGLIRGGVAPDHQSIKNVYRRYEKTNLADNVRFVGNLSIGTDVSLDTLLELYDAVILATGAPDDRALSIPGEDKTGVIGSAAFVGWYNSHPDFIDLNPDLDIAAAAVIGNGNVAIDVARVLAKTPAEMASSDLARHAAERIHAAPIRDIYMFGRRGPVEASFTPKELGELGELERCVPLVDAAQLPSIGNGADVAPVVRKNLAILQRFADNRPDDKPVRLHLMFYSRPTAVLGDDRVAGLEMERTRVEDGRCVGTGETFQVDCGMVVPCIGYRSHPIEGVAFDQGRGRFVNDDGLIADRLYCVGWAKRGPTGTIGTNKPDGADVAKRVLDDVRPAGRRGRAGLEAVVADKALSIVTFRDWKRIEAAEIAAARGEAPRAKFTRVEDMLKTAHPDGKG